MNFEGAFLRTKVARRILALFVLCALVPTASSVAITYWQTTDRARTDRSERLRHQGKLVADQVLERIRLVEVEFKRTVGRAQQGYARGDSLENLMTEADSVSSGLTDLAVETGSEFVSLLGSPPPLPVLTPETRGHLDRGATVLATVRRGPTDSTDAGVRVVLIRSVVLLDAPSLIWGTIDTERLARETTALSGSAEVCLVDETKSPIFCNADMPVEDLPHPGENRTTAREAYIEWESEGEAFAGAFALVFLAYDFAVPPWMVLVAESKSSTAYLGEFRVSSTVAAVLGLLMVIIMSSIQIRRSMRPLQDLTEATQRLAGGDLDARAEVGADDEFGMLAEAFNHMTRRLARQFRTLHALQAVDRTVLSTPSLERIADVALHSANGLLGSHSAALIVGDNGLTGVCDAYVMPRASLTADLKGPLRFNSDVLTRLAEEPFMITTPEAFDLFAEGSLAFAPTESVALSVVGESSTGAASIDPAAVLIFGFGPEKPACDDLVDQATQLSDQLAVALANVRMVSELDALSIGALEALATAVDAKSRWTRGHSDRVTRVGLALGIALNVSDEDKDRLHRGGLLHDIGKVGISEAILDSPNKLTDAEFDEIKTHPEIGARILSPIPVFEDLIPLALHHHERWDGTGYPMGLAGLDIPWLARILAVADAYDALTSDRPYREAMPVEKALQIMEEDSGSHFDPRVVEVLRPALDALGEDYLAPTELQIAVGQ